MSGDSDSPLAGPTSPNPRIPSFRPSFSLPLAIDTDIISDALSIVTNAGAGSPLPADQVGETLKSELFEIGSSGFTRTAAFQAQLQDTRDRSSSSPLTSSLVNSPRSNRRFLDSLNNSTLIQLGILGRGASGVVAKVIHKSSLIILALKVIDVGDKSKRSQVLRELKQLDSTRYSPYIVEFYGAYYSDGQVKLALEYMNRGSLQSILHTFGPLKERLLQSVTRQVLSGLLHLHKSHAIHRDIKPGNVLINWRGEAKLSDFGILGELQNTFAMAETFVGTTIYMSPERLTSSGYSYNADVWSWGMSLITLATGKFPLNTVNGYWGIVMQLTEEVAPELPKAWKNPNGELCHSSAEFRDFVRLCLIKNPSERPGAESLLSHPWINSARPMEELVKLWPTEMKMWKPGAISGKERGMIGKSSNNHIQNNHYSQKRRNSLELPEGALRSIPSQHSPVNQSSHSLVAFSHSVSPLSSSLSSSPLIQPLELEFKEEKSHEHELLIDSAGVHEPAPLHLPQPHSATILPAIEDSSLPVALEDSQGRKYNKFSLEELMEMKKFVYSRFQPLFASF